MLCVYKKSEAIKHKKAEEMKQSTYYSTCLSPPFAVCSSRNFL